MTVKFGVLAEMNDVLDKTFSFIITWMRFPRKDELHGTLCITDDPRKSLDIGEEQRRALVGCESPRKTDRERVWIHRTKPCPAGCRGYGCKTMELKIKNQIKWRQKESLQYTKQTIQKYFGRIN